jgi:hypothetical protein
MADVADCALHVARCVSHHMALGHRATASRRALARSARARRRLLSGSARKRVRDMERWRSAAMEALVARDHTACTGARQGCRATVNQWPSRMGLRGQLCAGPGADVG